MADDIRSPRHLAFRPEALEALSRGTPDERVRAALELGAVKPGRADVDAALLRAARDPVHEVRRAAIRSLVISNPNRASRPLVAAIREVDEDEIEADPALTSRELVEYPSLSRLQSIDSTHLLLEAMTSPEVAIRAGAASTLDEVDDPRVRQALRNALRDPAPDVRANAAGALARVGASGERDLIHTLADDPEPRVRAAAATALGVTGGRDAMKALRRARADHSRTVRKAAGCALREERLARRHTPERAAAEIKVYETFATAHERLERRFGARAALLVFLSFIRPLLKLYFKIWDAVPRRGMRHS